MSPAKLQQKRSGVMFERLKSLGLKLTPQRRAIVRRFAADESHPTAQELFERLRGDFPNMSFATVYNTLDALTEAGLSSTLRMGSGRSGRATGLRAIAGGREANAARFDPNIEPHHHAVCDRCGAIVDVPARSLAPGEAVTRVIEDSAPGFSVRAVERIYRGLCGNCLQAGAAKKQDKVSKKEK